MQRNKLNETLIKLTKEKNDNENLLKTKEKEINKCTMIFQQTLEENKKLMSENKALKNEIKRLEGVNSKLETKIFQMSKRLQKLHEIAETPHNVMIALFCVCLCVCVCVCVFVPITYDITKQHLKKTLIFFFVQGYQQSSYMCILLYKFIYFFFLLFCLLWTYVKQKHTYTQGWDLQSTLQCCSNKLQP